ncbi:MAG: zinc-dependent metalloprotease [Myxococcota bacterium]
MRRLNVLLAAWMLAGCGLGVGDIDRTQPNKIKKSIFQGEWFFRQTVVDVPYTTGFTFVGEQSEYTERITWDVQESFLIAYRAYDYVAQTDRTSALPGDHEESVPVAIFPIVSHFDIQREYNAQTGEQTNVIVENTVDRPWYERQYMRVDWSQNLAANFMFLVGNVPQVPGTHFVQVPGDPDALLVARKVDGAWQDLQGDAIAGLDEAQYIDVVHRIFASPETIEVEDEWGTIYEDPACWYYGNVDCYPAEIAVRSAFLKVDPNNGYVAREYPDNEIQRDENGNPIRVNYVDRDSLEPDPEGFIARADYFDKFGYFRTERERYDRQRGETNTGRIFLINRFNIWEDAPGCVDEGSATPYAACTVKPIVYFLSPGFPADMREAAVATAQGWNEAFKETVRALKYGDQRPLAEVEDVVLLKDNTFRAENGVVKDRGQRIGDLRYNLLYWVDEANQSGLLGYGPSATDPLTGEIINAQAFMYGAGVDTLAQRGKDIIDLLNDPTRLLEFVDGEDVTREVHLRTADDPAPRQRTREFVRSKVDTARNKALRQGGLNRIRTDGGKLRSRLDALKDTPLESALIMDPIVRALGNGQPLDGAITSADRDRFSPRHWAMGQALRRERRRMQHLAKHRAEHTRYFDPSVVGLAQSLKDEDPARVYQLLRERIFRSVAEHEVGHTLGLRHNFEASSDALNYGSTYWELRGDDGEALQPMSAEQIAGGMREHQYSSIMDYGSRFMSDIAGLGLYDKAAIAFGYGDLVYAFNTPPDEPLLELATLEDILRNWRHYTKFPRMFGGIEAMHDRRLVPYRRIIDQLTGRATWDIWEVPFRFCSDEYDGATATCATYDEGADPYEIAQGARASYLEYVPFLAFSRDRRDFSEWDYLSTVWMRAFAPMLTQYQNWVFQGFYYESEWECMRSDDGDCDQDPGVDAEYYRADDVPWAEADDGGLTGAAATRLFMDTIAEVVAQPEPGSYKYDGLQELEILYWYGDVARCQGTPGPDCSDLIIPFGTGRYTNSYWDYDSGYYFYDRLMMVGSFYDKMVALEAAVTSDTYFLGVDTGADVQRYAIGLNLYFPEEINRLVGGTSSEDYPVISGVSCTQDGSYHPPVLSRPFENPCNNGTFRYVDPATSFTVELYAIWYGMAFLNLAFDTSFNDRMKIWLEGAGEGFTPTDDQLVTRFVNPLNNRTYLATCVADPTVYCPGVKLLERAQSYADAYTANPTQENRWTLENLVATVEDVRGTYDVYGYLFF